MTLSKPSAHIEHADPIEALAHQQLSALERAGTLRTLRTFEGPLGPRMRVEGREVLMFSSGNYLDLAHHPEVVAAAAEAALGVGTAASGSRLITGNLSCHDLLERELAEFFGKQAALVFSTGYMLNVGVIPALVGPSDVVFSDSLVHASIIDGVRLSRAEVVIFPHGDVDGLRERVRERQGRARRMLIVVDGVYSMDGDLAPLAGIAGVASEFDAMFMVDDAHGTGTLGKLGQGAVELHDVLSRVDILAGTLGKGLGSFGAFLVGSHRLRDLLINTARSFIFSCALPPPQVEAARAALRIVQREPWRRQALQERAQTLRMLLQAGGLSTAPSNTHIVPVILGDNARTMTVTRALLERGFHAQGIRYPSVPEGTARLRLTPMATHTDREVRDLAAAVLDVTRSIPAAG
ncbi:MAG: 8-amino-7-oxononanoate synthase [Myxococcales bacterium]